MKTRTHTRAKFCLASLPPARFREFGKAYPAILRA
jgi:hypothetical protein